MPAIRWAEDSSTALRYKAGLTLELAWGGSFSGSDLAEGLVLHRRWLDDGIFGSVVFTGKEKNDVAAVRAALISSGL